MKTPSAPCGNVSTAGNTPSPNAPATITKQAAFVRGEDDRKAGRPLISHTDIPDGEMWDSYMDGYESVVGGPVNPCEADWLNKKGVDADLVVAAQLEYLRAGGVASPLRRKLEAKLTNLLPKLDRAESDLRRAFNRWESYRKMVRRAERKLDALAPEESASVT